MSEIKKTPKKLRNRETIEVDNQILRRRQMLAATGILLGKASREAKKNNEKQRKARRMDTDQKLLNKKWF